MIEFQDFAALLLQAAITIAAPIFAALAFKGYKWFSNWVAERLDDRYEAILNSLVGVVVRAAEQSGVAGIIRDTGAAKKDYAIKTLQALLRARGLDVLADNVPELSARIEEAVLLGLQNPDDYIAIEGSFDSDDLAELQDVTGPLVQLVD